MELWNSIENGRKAMKNQDAFAGRYTKYILEKIIITVFNYK